MIAQWVRDDDRLIAEKVECWKTRILNRSDLPSDRPPIVVFSEWDGNSDGQDNSHGCWWKDDDGKRYFSIPFYDHDLEAAIRAAEAWRKENSSKRRYSIDSPWSEGDKYEADFRDISKLGSSHSTGETAAEAICQALKKAVVA